MTMRTFRTMTDVPDTDLRFDLWSLRVFLSICETGSMTAAAQQLKMTQPAVSRVIQQLERAVGLQLIDRDLRPIALTGAGGMLRQRAAHLMVEALQIVPAMRQSAQGRLSMIRIGLVDSVASLLGPMLTRELGGVANQLMILSGLSIMHGDSLLKRQLDLIITSDVLEDVDGLERTTLIQEPHIVLLPAKLKGAPIRTLEGLVRKMPLIRYSARSLSGIQIDRHLRRLALDIPRRQEFDSTEMVVAMVAAGLGWAITTPLCLLSTQYDPKRVLPVPLPGPSLRRRVLIISRSGELGRIPSTIAEAAREIFLNRCMPRLQATMPWIASQVRISSHDAI